jgi:hypothetical protein
MDQYVKDRTECFDDLLPCMKEECDRGHVNNWVRVFRFFHNHVRVNEETGRAPMGYDDERPEYQRFIDLLSEEALT